jgi:carnosine N-methyltransferase
MVNGRSRRRRRQEDNVYRILVPGAGLGRLAHDLSSLRVTDETNGVSTTSATTRVHAVELSWTMVALAATLLSSTDRRWTIYPYLNDFWTNEISSERRFQSVTIPDVVDLPSTADCLSWTVADFCELARMSEETASYDMVITCFFVDTATNVLDYVDGMKRLLRPGGRWINVGPLHWHANARLVLTVEDLRALLEELGWEILKWSVDAEPLEYRSITFQDGQSTSTRYEAYRPLRFVVQRRA